MWFKLPGLWFFDMAAPASQYTWLEKHSIKNAKQFLAGVSSGRRLWDQSMKA